MSTRWIIIFLIMPFFFGSASKPSNLRFYKGSFVSAKETAARDGKLFMVDFTAKWCLPCRWMEETTFSNPEVIKYIEENYVAAKVDIDDFDGFAYKQIYGIKALPSILIFNSKGEKLAQYQESMSPSKLLAILKQHNKSENRIHASGNQSSLVHTITENNQSKKLSATNTPTVSKPSKPVINKPTYTPPTPTIATRPVLAPTKKAKVKIATPERNEVMSDEGLYRFTVTKQVSKGFSVQIGAFKEYGNVLREVEKLEKQFNEPILVHITKLNGNPVYKIMVGSFGNRNEATSFKKQVVNKGLQALVKDLATIG